jgi:hypothetical protein
MCVMENLAFLLDCSGHCVFQYAELTSLLRWYSWASTFPSQEYQVRSQSCPRLPSQEYTVIAGTLQVFKESVLARG